MLLSDMIKRYNPEVVGYATGSGDYKNKNAHLNVGNPGDEARLVITHYGQF